MKDNIDMYLDEDIPPMKGKKGLQRILCLLIQRKTNPSYDSVYMVRFCNYYNKERGIKGALRFIYKNSLVRKYGIFCNNDQKKIGKGLVFPHPSSIVIGSGVEIGDNVTIYQNTTIGAKKRGIDKDNAYPIIGNNCVLYAGAVLIGSIRVANDSSVGANAVLMNDTKQGGIYVGSPAKKVGGEDRKHEQKNV